MLSDIKWNRISPSLYNIISFISSFFFSGDDPKTDFRGMGVLGLENLLFLASEYTHIAHRMLSRSQHPKHGYAFAIVG